MVNYGFELVREQNIPEIKTTARLFCHVKTGASLLSLENDDENKVFGITFRTPPKDSTGVAHIMEHSVLCGSRKYPLKEPFVELQKGSLKTFLNAFTYPDKTCYPVASQNKQDFYNLIDVYLDAVFYPLISPLTLQQEGWHYELEKPEEPLTFKGVVFNEMKGDYSSPDNLLGRHTQHSIFPDNPYGVDSGGDPAHIPDLTYPQFLEFHQKYYHPSNSYIYFYGDDDPVKRLQLLDNYLKEFDQIQVDSSIPLQPRFDQARRVIVPYQAGGEGEDRKGMFTTNWLLTDSHDAELALGLDILSHILVGTPASPLRKALIDSGLGEDLTGGGVQGELRQLYFSTGLKGVALDDIPKAQELVERTLSELVENGIDPDMIAAAVNTIEFQLREKNTGSFPRGLLIMLTCLTTWLYDGDPLSPLAFEVPLAAIKQKLDRGDRYFENLIRQYLLGNFHHTTVILKPDARAGEEREAAEKARLEQARMAMDQDEVLKIIENTRLLKQRQETPDTPVALATIPVLKLTDLDRQNKLIPLADLDLEGNRIFYHDLFTNGILYLDIGFDLHNLPQEFLPYVSLFGRALLEMGTESEDFVRLSQRIGRDTGGIHTSPLTSLQRETRQGVAWLFMRSKSTVEKSQMLLDILHDVLLTVKLDNCERFRQMVLEEKASHEAGLVPAGHRIVNTRLRAQFDEAGWAAEQMNGVSYLFFLRHLADEVDKNWPAVLEKLETVRRMLVNRKAILCNVTLDNENWLKFRPQLASFLGSLPAKDTKPALWHPQASGGFEGLVIPAQVNYVGKGADLYQLGYKLSGSMAVITNYLASTWLWERVRVQGGAYGGFGLFDHRSGVFTFLSYRDPNLLKTLEIYDHTGQFLRQLDLSQEELTKAIIGAIGELDAYQLPDAKGFTSMVRYLVGDTDEKRQFYREQVLETTRADFQTLGEVLEQAAGVGRVVVLGSQDAIQQANAAHEGWLEVIKVL
jgi:Zn-dependent M16 (insulinase) family peptidase